MEKNERLAMNEIIERLNKVYGNLEYIISEYDDQYWYTEHYDDELNFHEFYDWVNESKSQLKEIVDKLSDEVNKK